MSRNLSAAALQAALSQDSADDFVILMELSGAGIVGTIKLSDRFTERISEIPIRSISGNGSTVTVVTVDAHGFSTNDSVLLFGITGAIAYNGTYTVTVTNSTTFTFSSTTTGTATLTKDSKCTNAGSDILVYGTRLTTVLSPKTRPGYQFIPLQITLPDQQSSGAPRASLSISDVTQEVLPYLRNLEGPADVVLKVALHSNLLRDDIVTPIEAIFTGLKLVSISYNADTITADLVMDGLENEPFPAHNFTPVNFPGLF